MNTNERMATEVMGWRSDGNAWVLRWIENGFEVEDLLMKSDWHPDTDLYQALRCMNKAFGKEHSIDISFYKHQVIIFHKGKPIAQAGFVGEDTIPLAICEAILESSEKEYNR